MKLQINSRLINVLWWGLAALLVLVLKIPVLLFVVPLAIFLAFRRAGPISGWSRMHIAGGFLGWFVVNTLLSIWLLGGDWQGDPWGLVRGFILFGVNILALLVLSFMKGEIILGVFLGMFVNALGYMLFVEMEEFGSFIVLPFYLHFFYPSL